MDFQIINTNNPNSPTNTCVFCIFLAYDSITNIHIGLDRYAQQIEDLQKTKWRYYPTKIIDIDYIVSFYRGKSLKVFMSGDYELLCRIYGISGAAGT